MVSEVVSGVAEAQTRKASSAAAACSPGLIYTVRFLSTLFFPKPSIYLALPTLTSCSCLPVISDPSCAIWQLPGSCGLGKGRETERRGHLSESRGWLEVGPTPQTLCQHWSINKLRLVCVRTGTIPGESPCGADTEGLGCRGIPE